MPLNADRAVNLGDAPTTSDLILKFIRDSIADGSLDEGEPIRQDDVAKLFNVSKIPVREALKRLEAEGLVEFHRNKGAIVTSLSGPEIIEIFEVRAILESNAIRLSVPHMTQATFDAAESYCDAFLRDSNVARWSELNWQFHSCLYLDAERPFLVSTIRSVNDKLERYLRAQLTLSHGKGTADREHRQILEACRKQDADLASRLVYEHIIKASESLRFHLPSKKLPHRNR